MLLTTVGYCPVRRLLRPDDRLPRLDHRRRSRTHDSKAHLDLDRRYESPRQVQTWRPHWGGNTQETIRRTNLPSDALPAPREIPRNGVHVPSMRRRFGSDAIKTSSHEQMYDSNMKVNELRWCTIWWNRSQICTLVPTGSLAKYSIRSSVFGFSIRKWATPGGNNQGCLR
ncbi:hypothetical protein BS47DRAFT_335225 [Hydnum rufescens UP504]|uniref:Uncharacterized protein n=1 Tax=Hydnum rufescens UP504 TaxID=1448309 RepID=A0A9P6B5X6_9AGAM|nr:hypothetical protein BS47DRAFT_335225 [Hydnum rufescens UP504]